MVVRDATDRDIIEILGLILDFSKELPVDCAEKAISPRKAAMLIKLGISLGLCKVALSNGSSSVVGCVLGIVSQNIWSDHINQVEMLCLYVKPEHRKGTAGGRLIKSYIKSTEKLIKQRTDIGGSIVYAQPQGTNINYEKLGFSPLQVQFLKER